MERWLEMVLLGAPLAAGIFVYFIRLESKLATILTDLTWIKLVLESRRKPRG